MTNSNDMPLAAKPLDRAAHRRTDEAWLQTAMQQDDALFFLMRKGDPFVEKRGLFWMGPEARKLSPASPTVFMGEDKQGAPVFALNLPDAFDVEESLIAGAGTFSEFRMAAGAMADMEANLVSTARSVFLWHASHGHCAKCGGRVGVVDAGWKTQCPECGTEHFPRTDPVAIMLAVKDGKCLIGRQAMWPAGFMSCLAGFCEPGETIEQAAARELFEEAGIKCDPASAEYIACQPWPFPSSLMVGLILEAENFEITLDKNEIDEARWITRAEAREIISGQHAELFCPPKMAIAHHILRTWALRDD
ncbi:MAG: NAD(+) diphosphatase [Hyphomonas sp.]|uniref:NAD(+) diphosphatase n=1 Tax=Hyphomonas sp. BRH_c22 TaxID=1629710 RepID=UPI00261B4DEF|nr:NAD(+) diphosphatase [Hyphomonas sp. BRH_c22]